MSLSNPDSVVTEQRLSEFYNEIYPYLGGSAAAGFTPVGTIISVMGVTAPTNYLACNGQTVNIADYPELAAYFKAQFGSVNKFGGNGTTTFAICDLRGEFLRGTGTNSHTLGGNGAAVGTHQDPTEIPYSQFQNNNNGKGNIYCVVPTIPSGGTAANSNPANMDKKGSTTIYGDGIIATSATVNTRDITGTGSSRYSARPTNTSVLYCIATKNIYLNPSLDYSTSEKVVGTYIDGKPVYQKTLTVASISKVSTTTLIANVDTLISATQSHVRGGVREAIDSFYNTASDYFFAIMAVNNNNFYVYWNGSSAVSDWIITVQYTKTT